MGRITISGAVVMIAAAFFAVSAGATEKNTKTSGMIYHVPINYSDSLLKDDAKVTGAYLYYGVGAEKSYELGIDFTDITYIPNTDYSQRDLTLAYTSYKPKKNLRYGAHFISSSTDTNDGFTLFVGGTKFPDPDRSLQINAYYSSYDNSTPGIKVIQLSPAYGRTYKRENGNSVLSLTSLHYIKLNENVGIEGDDFISIEQSVTYQQENYSVTFRGWTGEQMFAAANGGFTIYNKPELNEAGYGIAINFKASEEYNVTLGADVERFKDTGLDNKATGRKYSIMLGRGF